MTNYYTWHALCLCRLYLTTCVIRIGISHCSDRNTHKSHEPLARRKPGGALAEPPRFTACVDRMRKRKPGKDAGLGEWLNKKEPGLKPGSKVVYDIKEVTHVLYFKRLTMSTIRK